MFFENFEKIWGALVREQGETTKNFADILSVSDEESNGI